MPIVSLSDIRSFGTCPSSFRSSSRSKKPSPGLFVHIAVEHMVTEIDSTLEANCTYATEALRGQHMKLSPEDAVHAKTWAEAAKKMVDDFSRFYNRDSIRSPRLTANVDGDTSIGIGIDVMVSQDDDLAVVHIMDIRTSPLFLSREDAIADPWAILAYVACCNDGLSVASITIANPRTGQVTNFDPQQAYDELNDLCTETVASLSDTALALALAQEEEKKIDVFADEQDIQDTYAVLYPPKMNNGCASCSIRKDCSVYQGMLEMPEIAEVDPENIPALIEAYKKYRTIVKVVSEAQDRVANLLREALMKTELQEDKGKVLYRYVGDGAKASLSASSSRVIDPTVLIQEMLRHPEHQDELSKALSVKATVFDSVSKTMPAEIKKQLEYAVTKVEGSPRLDVR